MNVRLLFATLTFVTLGTTFDAAPITERSFQALWGYDARCGHGTGQ
jgi:hypothetical protein